jgi:3-polyprenyl-4-hydroxybenzoate decarboxylase
MATTAPKGREQLASCGPDKETASRHCHDDDHNHMHTWTDFSLTPASSTTVADADALKMPCGCHALQAACHSQADSLAEAAPGSGEGAVQLVEGHIAAGGSSAPRLM